MSLRMSLSARRAWIEMQDQFLRFRPGESLSARRAWIEIATPVVTSTAGVVALRKESVDRNHQPTGISEMGVPSLSARRAWIEIISALV